MLSQSQVIATQIPGGGVLVAAAYRLNTLGWLADASLDEESGFSGNYGLLDAIAALEWVRVATKHYQQHDWRDDQSRPYGGQVRDNIDAFGGDRGRVTIFGHSSGGTLVFALLSAPKADGLFSAAFSSSGSPNITQATEAALILSL
jgi:para-nitrobenzyl esterase